MDINYIFHSNIINFIIVLAFFIWLLFFKLDVIGLLGKKSEETINTIKKSEDKKQDAIQHLADTKTSLENVDSDIKAIVQNAKELAQKMEEKTSDKIKDELDNLKNRANILKAGYESKAKEEITKKIANAAVAVSKEYIENSLDENSQKELIYNFINDLENMRVD